MLQRHTSDPSDDLPEAVRRYADSLPAGEILAYPLTPLDRSGIPTWIVYLHTDPVVGLDGETIVGVGYGATDEQALTGAFGELCEDLFPLTHLGLCPRRRGSFDELASRHGRDWVLHPADLCPPAGSEVGSDTPLVWVEGTRWRTGSKVLVPIDVVALSARQLPAGYEPFAPLITNGLGAGFGLEAAIAHGLLECLQRDANSVSYRALDQGMVVDGLDKAGGRVGEILDAYRRAHIEPMVKHASSDFGVANVYVVGFDTDGREPRTPIMLAACGEACDLDLDRAVEKALLEFGSSRARLAHEHGPLDLAESVAPEGHVARTLDRLRARPGATVGREFASMAALVGLGAGGLREVLDRTIFSRRSSIPYDRLQPTHPDPGRTWTDVADELASHGFDLIHVDCSPRDGDARVVKVVVPGFEVETMSHHRIGARNARRLMSRHPPMVDFEAGSPEALPIVKGDALGREFGDATLYLDTRAVDRAVGPLHAIYREPAGFSVSGLGSATGGGGDAGATPARTASATAGG